MAERLVLEIEIPGFHTGGISEAVDNPDLVLGYPASYSRDDVIDEEIEQSMNCADEVVVIFRCHPGEKEGGGDRLEALEGRIVRRRLTA